MTLQQAIGLKSPIAEGLIFLGTRVRIVALTSFNSKPELKKSLMAATTSLPTIC
jgi:hypothetical protein